MKIFTKAFTLQNKYMEMNATDLVDSETGNNQLRRIKTIQKVITRIVNYR